MHSVDERAIVSSWAGRPIKKPPPGEVASPKFSNPTLPLFECEFESVSRSNYAAWRVVISSINISHLCEERSDDLVAVDQLEESWESGL